MLAVRAEVFDEAVLLRISNRIHDLMGTVPDMQEAMVSEEFSYAD